MKGKRVIAGILLVGILTVTLAGCRHTDVSKTCLLYTSGLVRYETFYKMLDLYYQFSTRLGKNIDADRLVREREKTEETIMRLSLIHICGFKRWNV